MNKRFFSARPGFILPVATIWVVISLVLGIGILSLGAGEQGAAIRRTHREQAFYIAEAGLNLARAELEADPSLWENQGWPPAGLAEFPPGSGHGYRRARAESPDRIVSEGVIRDSRGAETARVSISLEVVMDGDDGGNGDNGSVFSRGIFGRGRVFLGGSSEISSYNSETGEFYPDVNVTVGSNQEIEIQSSGTVFGDVSVGFGGEIIEPFWRGGDAIKGDRLFDADERVLPPVEIPGDLAGMPYTVFGMPGLGGNYQLVNGHYSVSMWPRVASISAGNYRFKSFSMAAGGPVLTFSGRVRLYIEEIADFLNNARVILEEGAQVTLYLGENVNTFRITGSSAINVRDNTPHNPPPGKPGDFAIFSAASGNIEYRVTGNARVYAALYAPEVERFYLDGSSEWHGGVVISEVLYMQGNPRLYEDVALRGTPPPGAPGGNGGAGDDTFLFINWAKPGWGRFNP